MVVIVTRDVADRFRGFLTSVMLEIAPGVYTSPSMSAGTRQRVWGVLEAWFESLGGGSIVMTWKDARLPGKQGLATLGLPRREFVVMDGTVITRAEPTHDKQLTLEKLQSLGKPDSPKQSGPA